LSDSIVERGFRDWFGLEARYRGEYRGNADSAVYAE
jgi:hypothetical protein